MVYKSLNGLAPGYLRSRFVERSAVTDYSLRNTKDKLAVPLPRTNFLKNSFRYSGAVSWNSLPTHVRQARTLESFQRLLLASLESLRNDDADGNDDATKQ